MENKKEYYYVSSVVVEKLPHLIKSKKFDNSYIIETDNFGEIELLYATYTGDEPFFAWQIIDSLVDLNYEGIDYTDDDEEVVININFGYSEMKEWGIITGIEQELGISKEMNIAYVFYKLAKKYNLNPIEMINKAI